MVQGFANKIRNGRIQLYKALRKQDAGFLDDGSLLFGSLKCYREMEKKWIGDPMEGRVAHVIDHLNTSDIHDNLEDGYLVIRNPYNPDQILLKARAGAGTNNIISNSILLGSYPNIYVFCVSIGPIDLIMKGWNKYPEAGYLDPALLEIVNPVGLIKAILDGSVEIDGITFKFLDKFQPRVDLNYIRYQKVVHSFQGKINNDPSPLVKSPEFNWQREARFLTYPLSPMFTDRIKIIIGRNDFFKVCDS